MTRLFVPAFDALWQESKLRLRQATRAIFLQLCIVAREARRNGMIVLPPAADEIHAVMRICEGFPDEIETALRELTDARDPMIAVKFENDRRTIKILSWSAWSLVGAAEAKQPLTPSERVARCRAKKRIGGSPAPASERTAAPQAAPVATPVLTPDVTVSVTSVNESVNGDRYTSVTHLGGKGGLYEKDKIREYKTKEEERRSDARANGREGCNENVNVGVNEKRYAENVTNVTPDKDDDPEPTTATLDGRFLAALRASPHIEDYERRGTVRLADCATMLAGLASTAQLAQGLTVPQSEERVIAAIGDVNGKIGDANLTSNPWQPAHVTARLRTFAEGNLRKPRAMWEADRQRALNASTGNGATQAATNGGNGHGGPALTAQSAELLALFGQLWSKANKGEPWVQAPSDAATAAKIAGPLADAASKAGCTFTAMVSHKVGGYLADGDPFLRDKAWPLALFASKVGGYGVPRKKVERAPEPERREFTPEEIEANRIAAAAALRQFSSAGIGLRKVV